MSPAHPCDGGPTDLIGELSPRNEESIRVIHHALDAGINFVDTADGCSGGESEEIVGKAERRR